MPNVIRCKAKAESCAKDDAAEKRDQKAQKTGEGAKQSEAESQCPLTKGGGDGGKGGASPGASVGAAGAGAGTGAAGAAGAAAGAAATTAGAAAAQAGAAAITGATAGAAAAAIDCGKGGGGAPPEPPPQPAPVEQLGLEPPRALDALRVAKVALGLAPPAPDLAAGDLKVEPQETQQNKDTGADAVAEVVRAYAGVRRDARTRLAEQRAEANRTLMRLDSIFAQLDERLRVDHGRLDEQLLAAHRRLVMDLHLNRDGALARIEEARAAERLAILGIGAAARVGLQQRIDGTEGRIGELVGEWLKPYKDHLNAEKAAASKDMAAVETSLAAWKAGIPSAFPTSSGDALVGAQNEGKRETATCKIDEEIPRTSCQKGKFEEAMGKLADPFETNARESLAGPMRQEAARAKACGFNALAQATASGVGAVERTADQARAWVMSQAAATERLLIRLLNTGRAQLRDQVDAKRHELRDEAERARARVKDSHDNAASGLGDGLATYRESVLGAAAQGESAVQNVGLDGAGRTRASFATLGERFHTGVGGIEKGARTGLDQRWLDAGVALQAAVEQQAAAARAQLAGATETSDASLAERLSGLAQVRDGIRQTAEQWTADATVRFATLIEQIRGTLTQCEGAFKESVGKQRTAIDAWLAPRRDPAKLIEEALNQIAADVKGDIESRVKTLADELDDLHTSDKVVTAALRSLTKLQGVAVTAEYEKTSHSFLILDIARGVSGDDYDAAMASLAGDVLKAAKFELKASLAWYNDDEQRIRDVMRSLDDDQLKEFVKQPGVAGTLADVRDSLGGVDLDVFDTLTRTDLDHTTRLARADAQDLKDRIGNADSRDEINQELAKFYSGAKGRQYGKDVSDADLRRLINDQMADVLGAKDEKTGKSKTGEEADKAVSALVKERHKTLDERRYGQGGRRYQPQGAYGEQFARREQAESDRAFALIEKGVGSEAERIAALGVEMNRAGGARMEEVDKALVDPRMNPANDPRSDPSLQKDPEKLKAATETWDAEQKSLKAARQAMLAKAGETYGDPRTAGERSPGEQVADQLKAGQSDLGKQVVDGLIADGFPSANTTSLIIELAAEGLGTNEDLMKQATTRLTKGQLNAAEDAYKARNKRKGGKPGTLWELVASETSGQDFLDLELAWLGQPRNDKERAMVALFALHQQRREAGGLGAALMSGSQVERIMDRDEARLRGLVGDGVTFSKPGDPPSVEIKNGNFDDKGDFKGDRADFAVATEQAQAAAQLYAKSIDEWADAVTTTIMIIGAIVATVVTGGGAGPLAAALIAGATGLASMAAKQAIRGGRYGWEEAVTDLGVTAVQMLTAGLGRALQQAAWIQSMGKVGQAVVPAMITGGLDSLGQTALNDATWSKGIGEGIGELIAGTVRGVVVSSVAALGTAGVQRLGLAGRTIGDIAGDSTNTVGRGLAQSVSSGTGAFLSRGAELGFDKLRGKYRGDAGDIFVEMAKAGGQAGLQGFAEGAGEAWRDRNRIATGLYSKPAWMSDEEYAHRLAEKRAGTGEKAEREGGTAAAIAGSRFTGDAHKTPQFDDTHVTGQLHGLAGDGGQFQGRVHPDPDGRPNRARVDLEGGGSVEVRIKVVADMPAEGGQVPVARFERKGRLIEIQVSAHADADMVGRALAHELGEIRQIKQPKVPTEDVLKAGGGHAKDGDEKPRLTPHDHGRIAETEWLQRALHAEQTRQPPDPKRLQQLTEEMASLLAHLGVVGDAAAPTRRRELLFEHLTDSRLKVGLEASVEAARANPRLRYAGGRSEEALQGMIERWQRAQTVGDEAGARALLEQIQRKLMAMERIHTDQRLKADKQQRLIDGIDEHIGNPALVDALKAHLAAQPKVKQGHLAADPVASDPDAAQATRNQFGDRRHFQDWPEFKKKYFATFKSVDASNPADLNRAWHEWQCGSYVGSKGRLRSVVTGVVRPDPGFEARWVKGVGPKPEESKRLPGALGIDHDVTPIGHPKGLGPTKDGDLSPALKSHIDAIAGRTVEGRPTHTSVDEAAALRHALLVDAAAIEARRNDPNTSHAEAERLRQVQHALEHQARRLSESLGEAAAQRVAELDNTGDWEPIPLPRRGAGLPDVVYRDRRTGRLLIIEAKGGESGLGVRLSQDRTRIVEQGTRAYLESLAHAMRKNPATEALGDEILNALAVPGGVDYRVVRQPFDPATGRPLAPEVGHFELGPPPAQAVQGRRTAAAVPGSAFHGEARGPLQRVLDRLLGRALTPERLARHAEDWLLSEQGIAGQVSRARGAPDIFGLESPGKPAVRVRIEVVPASELPVHNGRRDNADWHPDPTGQAGYVVRVSADMDPRQVGRALAHEFRELHEVHFGEAGHTGLRGGETSERRLDLSSPHGRARLEEVQWLANRIAEGDLFGSRRRELAALLDHLGAGPHAEPARRAKVLASLQEQGALTPAVWRAAGGDGLLPRLLPADPAARRQADPVLRALGDDHAHLAERLAQLEARRADLACSQGEPPPVLSELLAERAALLERVAELGVAELARQYHERGLPLPPFEQLAAARDALYRSLGVEPPSHSRQDLENFLREIWKQEQAGALGTREAERSDRIYQEYSASAAKKQFSTPEQAAAHREALLALMRDQPAGATVESQNAVLKLLLEVMGNPPAGTPANDWIHATRKTPPGAAEPTATHRVYVNPPPEATAALMREVLAVLILAATGPQAGGPYKVKAHSDPAQVEGRAEGLTIYSADEPGMQRVVEFLLRLQAERGPFVPAVPRMAEPVGHGVAIADEPLDLPINRQPVSGGGYQIESFGKVRADAIAAALTRVARLPAEERSFEQLMKLVEEELVKRGIDPLRPHRNLEPDDPRRRGQCRLPLAGESDDDESVMRRC
jgi:hypothetical protein